MDWKTVQRFDVFRVDSHARTPEGFLDVDLMATRVGVFDYGDHRELRSEGEVFKADSLATFDALPLTNNHPFKLLDSKDAKQHTVGFQTGPATRKDADGEMFLATRVRVIDENTILDIEGGKVEISMGYSAQLEFAAGVFKDEKFDAVQRNIRYNHIAIVDQGRGGSKVKLKLDSAFNQIPEEDSMFKLVFDGITYEVKDEAEGKKLEALLTQGKTDAGKVDAAEKKVKELTDAQPDAAKNLELLQAATGRGDAAEGKIESLQGKLDAQATELKDAIDPTKQGAMVQARIDLLTLAKTVKVKDEDTVGKTDSEIKKLIILAVNKDAKLDEATEAYMDGQIDFISRGTVNRTDAANKTGAGIMENIQTRVAQDGSETEKTDAAQKKFDEREKARATQPLSASKNSK